MSKEILLLFQDCFRCEPYEKWTKRQEEFAKEHNIKIIETPFTAPGARDLIIEGDKNGFEALPFFTDGNGNFSRELADFFKAAEGLDYKPTKRKKARAKNKVEDKANEVVPEE